MNQRYLQDYLGRLTSRWRNKPKYLAFLKLALQPLVDAQNLQARLPTYFFDIDDAVGPQLDAVGERVGLSRAVAVPIVGVYFSFDDAVKGWDLGTWRGPYDTDYGIVRLDDQTYRRLLYVKAVANGWDGTVEQAQTILESLVDDPDVYIMYEEHLQSFGPSAPSDAAPSVTIGTAGKLPPLVIMFLMVQNAVPLKPNGVSLEYTFTSIDETPLFGFDVQNDRISGWDSGSWGVDAEYVAINVVRS